MQLHKELAVFTVLSLNILQAYIGLKYPPPHCQPLESPVKRAQVQSPPPARPLKLGTPLVSFTSSICLSFVRERRCECTQRFFKYNILDCYIRQGSHYQLTAIFYESSCINICILLRAITHFNTFTHNKLQTSYDRITFQ